MKIEKKVWPEYFKKIKSGDKTFELRLADWKCETGDVLILKEWDPKTKEYTGRKTKKKVTYVIKTKDQKFWTREEIEKHGLQIIAFK
jgi:ASC-1-like (ASCH) protein